MSKVGTKKDSDILAFVKAITKLSQKQEDFMKSVEELKELSADNLSNVQLELKTKREELDDLTKQYDTQKKDMEIKLVQEINEYGYEKAIEIIEEHKQIAVNMSEYDELKQSVELLKTTHEKDMKSKIAELNAIAKKELERELLNTGLKHKAEIAELSATVKQLEKERKTYESTIDNLKQEVASQRELTRQVAEASKQGAISQNFGK